MYIQLWKMSLVLEERSGDYRKLSVEFSPKWVERILRRQGHNREAENFLVKKETQSHLYTPNSRICVWHLWSDHMKPQSLRISAKYHRWVKKWTSVRVISESSRIRGFNFMQPSVQEQSWSPSTNHNLTFPSLPVF